MPPRDYRLNPPIPALYPERDALLAAVRDAHPDDDLPALVYADWQDEHGQPEHAELIRVMVELAKNRVRTPEAKARRPKLLTRMKELFKTPPLKPLRKLESDTWNFERGFIRHLTLFWYCQPEEEAVNPLLFCGPGSILDMTTIVPFDKVTGFGVMFEPSPSVELVEALAGQQWLRRVNRLETNQSPESHIRPGVFEPLIRSPNIAGLQQFDMEFGTIAANELTGLYLAKVATGLRQLTLAFFEHRVCAGNSRRPNRKAFTKAVEQIVSAKRAKQFTSFGTNTAVVDEPLAKILLASPYLTGIRTFHFLFDKVTAKTHARFIERFGLPMRS